jgi:hypothetical protein
LRASQCRATQRQRVRHVSRSHAADAQRQRGFADRARDVGVRNLLYFESSADTSGSATVTATFRPGTNVEMAQVDVQNRLKAIEARLPQAVRQTG